MPRIRPGMRKPPPGFDKVNDILNRYEEAMKDATHEGHEGKRKVELTWSISKINFQRTKHLFKMLRQQEISQDVFDYCGEVGFIDGALAKKWKLSGYERLCCVQCINPKNHDFGGSCICRVPMRDRRVKDVQCSTCGCLGCASGEGDLEDEEEEGGKGDEVQVPENLDGSSSPQKEENKEDKHEEDHVDKVEKDREFKNVQPESEGKEKTKMMMMKELNKKVVD